ncbi:MULTISPECIES: MFS transporter [unclassified Mycolicibacterium]|uniref:MFS transporter n=1 Tax=unclassified Mycolicibacterium TaxID=2636767 RepID=UPI002ED939AD
MALSVWFSATSVVPSLTVEWHISSVAAVWLTASVQIGFAIGAIVSAVANLADRIRPQVLLGVSACGAAALTLAFAWFAEGLITAMVLRFFTGVLLAGVYPVGMKIMASWSTSANRGTSFGLLIGALTVGSILPHLIKGIETLPWKSVMTVAACVAGAGGLVSLLFLRPGPEARSGRVQANPRYIWQMFNNRESRLANIGYFGHMWELYALWAWVGTFLVSSVNENQRAISSSASSATIFVTMGIFGLLGCLVGGWLADQIGRAMSAGMALAISGTCCLLSPFAFDAPWAVLVLFLAIWGAAVIADSGVFSTMLSETVDSRYVGTALTAQTAIGFLLTVVTIQIVPIIADAVGWRYAFLVLFAGPLMGVAAMRGLRSIF